MPDEICYSNNGPLVPKYRIQSQARVWICTFGLLLWISDPQLKIKWARVSTLRSDEPQLLFPNNLHDDTDEIGVLSCLFFFFTGLGGGRSHIETRAKSYWNRYEWVAEIRRNAPTETFGPGGAPRGQKDASALMKDVGVGKKADNSYPEF